MPLAPVKNRAHLSVSKKDRTLIKLRNLAIAVVLLGVVIFGVGLLIMWLMQPKKVDQPAATAPAAQKPSMSPSRKFGPNIPIGSAIQSISSPVAPGDNANVTLRTTEGATCTIKVVNLDQHGNEIGRVEDSGLADKKVDEFGVVTWTWTMPKGAALATWKADMFCKRDEMSTRSVGEVVVKLKDV